MPTSWKRTDLVSMGARSLGPAGRDMGIRPALQARLLRAVPWLDAACGVVFLLVAAAILEHLVRSA